MFDLGQPNKIFLPLVLLLGMMLVPVKAESVTLQVGLIQDGRPPYFWAPTESSPPKGIYIDILDAIARRTELSFNYRFLPQARIRLYMVKGLLDIEPGIDPSWRSKISEVNTSVYSDPFMSSSERMVTSKHYSNADNMQRSCVMLGFNSEIENSQTMTTLDEQQLLEMMDKNRCDFAVMPSLVIHYYLAQKKYNVNISAENNHFELTLRLFHQQQALLPVINQALAELRQSGELAEILSRY
ncbi:transporter substrate-binding domain-containing protein [uncultured Ferrimonas sp.]|uniref:substrate-binding periplasmic protein n=1 Tax=uncultured Ferrimonas sp. TaxID=432640 RepID=UPI00261FCBEC|nr:transporter substrate-binding domain-containing protein [uncultured Ferrimonas sp.]